MNHRKYLLFVALANSVLAYGQDIDIESKDSVDNNEITQTLNEVTIVRRKKGTSSQNGAVNGISIHREELFKAACCNLGESFTTNPSVDVSYDDAATGARQIKLLGLSGTYVQMLTENLPNFRGAAAPFALGYVPGPWLKSIQVSKGTASVKNGYESITGQMNLEYLKPEDEQGATINLYGNSDGRLEVNADGNIHLQGHLTTELLAHYGDNLIDDIDMNHDNFLDKPNVRQINLQNRWHWENGRYIFHGGIGLLDEKRESGQTKAVADSELFRIDLKTHRYEGYMKHAYILNPYHGTNIALIGSVSLHQLDAVYGHKTYSVNEKNAYAQLMFETNIAHVHNLSTGISINHDYLGYEQETTPGIYAQYTLNLHDRLTAMAGLRTDHSSRYGSFLTPRFHVKYTPADFVNVRLSAGKGYRTVHALAENNHLLASGRTLVIEPLSQESAWNYGVSSSFFIPMFGNTLKLNMEYYYTHFSNQAVIDYDSNPQEIRIADLHGKSYSHTFQIDATYPLLPGMELTAAYRLNDVKSTFGGRLMEKPLTSRYKGLFTASYKPGMGLWQFDATLQLNGGGRMPTPYALSDGKPAWNSHFPAYFQLQAQVTRWFRHFSIYVGGENLTNYRQHHPIICAENPWSKSFEPTMVWGPVSGAMAYAGIRININRLN